MTKSRESPTRRPPAQRGTRVVHITPVRVTVVMKAMGRYNVSTDVAMSTWQTLSETLTRILMSVYDIIDRFDKRADSQ
jgi:hypothetical protein